MKISTKFLLTVAAAGLSLPLIAAACGSEATIGEGEGEGEGEEGEGEEGEGEGEEPDCDLAAFGPGTLTVDGDIATFTSEGIDDTICITAGQQELFFVDVVVTDGDFANDVGGGDVEIAASQLSGGDVTFCSNTPITTGLDELGTLITCPVCLADGDTLEDLAIQIADNAGDLTPAVCAVAE